ncbi:TonB-linked SusC/RagA family outer membrane protein [Pedobacter africanus]|uniref:TonB-linked SusC/RagA family outer membrane protein n=1 Tax=Pedobacter africanus TaxID=151894 RepID=A0ACC6KSY1_9SPHI|nr:SusC/RagA family TonB-linked outer membrane protein [Pedobacter africanus]MDR6782322.1 TonB-linked SusC/RagA family outer membrane protein [Pedobacter africanus]
MKQKLRTCFCLLLLMAFSINMFAQKRITINVNKVSLDVFFQELRKKTGVEFVYSELQAKDLQPITLVAKNESLENILKKLLNNSKYTYTLKNKAVLIVSKEEAKAIDNQTHKDSKLLVKGAVVDVKGNSLARATVKVPGSTAFTMTDNNGLFNISVNEDEKQIQVSSVGFQTQLVNIEGKPKVNIILKDGTNNLDDVVVVAYGTTTKREQTGSISVVTAKEIADVPSSSVANLLQGRIAGMDVTNMSGSPGSGGTAIVIRGYNSLDVEQERRYSAPLWVIDGVPMNTFTSPITGTNLLSDLNPDMIESIQVLKDASSAAIYGSRAANGVILVTTKKGKSGQKATFAFNASQSLSILPRLPTITTGRGERWHRMQAIRHTYEPYFDFDSYSYKIPQSLKEVYEKGGSLDGYFVPRANSTANQGNIYQDSLNNFYNNSTNFFPLFFETAKVTNANFQTYGGSETMNYGIGLGYYKEDGILKGTGYNRIDFNTNMQVKPVKNTLVDARINFTTGARKRGTPSQVSSLRSAPLIETIPGDPLQLSSLYPSGDSPVWEEVRKKLEGTEETNRSFRIRSNLKLSYKFFKDFEISSSGALDYSLERRNFFTPSYLDVSGKGRNNSMGEQGINLMILNENLLTYRKNWDDHNFTILAGQSFQFDQNDYNGGFAMNTPSDLIWYASTLLPQYTKDILGTSETIVPLQRYMSDMSQKTLLSWFGRVEYNYKKRYLLSMAFRKDGSSVFGDNNKWGTFPSIGAGYNFSEDINWKPMNFGKIRFSWGRSGLQFYSPYLALGILQPSDPFQGEGTLEPQWHDGLYNEKLTWEQTDQYDIGLDLDFFDSRLSVVADYYSRFTDRLLDVVPLPYYNVYGSQWRNAAAISNEGLELLVKYEVFRKNDLYWKISLNAARNWNRFAKSYGNYAEANYNIGKISRILGKPLNGILAVQTNGIVQAQNELDYYYNSEGVKYYLGGLKDYARPGDWKVKDVDGDGLLGSGDYTYAGSALPIMSGGVGSEFKYKNFDLNFLFSFQIGRHILNLQPGNTLVTGSKKIFIHPLLIDLSNVSMWKGPGDQASYPENKFYDGAKFPSFTLGSDYYVQNVSWTKLKSLVFGYNWKNEWLKKAGIQQLRFFGSAENLFTLTNYNGMDPEVVDLANGIDDGTAYPLARKLTFGVTLKF